MHDQLCCCATCVEMPSSLALDDWRTLRLRSLPGLLRRAINSLRTRPGLLTMTREGKVVRIPRV